MKFLLATTLLAALAGVFGGCQSEQLSPGDYGNGYEYFNSSEYNQEAAQSPGITIPIDPDTRARMEMQQ